MTEQAKQDSVIFQSLTEPLLNGQIDIQSEWPDLNAILIFACFLLNAYCMVRKFKRINASGLKLEVTSGTSCVLLPVLKLPLCPVFCHIEMPHDVANLSVHGPWHSKKLYLNWGNFSVTNTLTNHTMLVPEKLNLNLWETHKLKKILRKPFFMYIHVQHNGFL